MHIFSDGRDYRGIVLIPEFDSDGVESIDIEIINDNDLECTDFFNLQLFTPLDFVDFSLNNATVTISSEEGEMIV